MTAGSIERLENYQSEYVTARNIDIWLPPGYSDSVRYPVLYMHDGQMLYGAESTWNGQSWKVDEVATALFEAGKIRKFILVGIWNGGETRHPDYLPEKPFRRLSRVERDTLSAQLQRAGRAKGAFAPKSEAYLKFIVKELMPYIAEQYSVYTDPANTFIAGSSMGGLISAYAICRYPRVFGGAACLSTHWPGSFTLEHNPFPDAMVKYLGKNLPKPGDHKIYFDCGDRTLDALYPAIQKKVDGLMTARGYDESNWFTGYFPGEDHSEASWNKRFHIPLEFLFGTD